MDQQSAGELPREPDFPKVEKFFPARAVYSSPADFTNKQNEPEAAAQTRSLVARCEAGGMACVLAKPQTFMNRSGRAARELLSDLDGPADLLVVCDDFHLPLGRLRCRRGGSDGGQLGLASVIGVLAADPAAGEVPRLRLGIGDPGRMPAEDYVLQPFGHGEQRDVEDMVDRAAACLEAWLAHGDLSQLIAAANAAPEG